MKASGEQWLPPDKGLVRFSFQQAVSVPTIEHAIKDSALDMLMRIVEPQAPVAPDSSQLSK